MGRNPPKFKILDGWLTVDFTDWEKINYKVYFCETKILFNIWTERVISPLGKRHFENSILSKVLQLRILLPNLPDGFIATP